MPISEVVLIAGGSLAWYGLVGFALNGVPYLGCRTRARRALLFGMVLLVLGLIVGGVSHQWLTLLGLSALVGLALQAVAWGMNYGLQQPGGETAGRQSAQPK
jgi:hypothetical protein